MNLEFNKSYVGLRLDILKYVDGEAVSVLDVGCSIGTNGGYLMENGIAERVSGIELDPTMASEAEKKYNRVYQGDLNSIDFRKEIISRSEQYDYILFGDVLEHLYDPDKVLYDLKELLKPNGKIIISLPNIAHIELFIQVYLKGSWPKNSRGIFDKTHIRWFTKKDAFKLVENCNLKIVSYEQKFRSRDNKSARWNWKSKLVKLLNKNLVTFQYIIVCTHAG